MKWKDYDQSIEVLDAETTTIVEKLSNLDPTTDEYQKAAMALKTIEEAKQTEVRNKSEHLNGLVPGWATALIGTFVGVLFGGVVLREERAGGVISSQAIALWDKVVRKF
jgi:hypothetical protein